MKTPTTGYYSVIQFCPDRSRLEAANVGVLLFVRDNEVTIRSNHVSGCDAETGRLPRPRGSYGEGDSSTRRRIQAAPGSARRKSPGHEWIRGLQTH